MTMTAPPAGGNPTVVNDMAKETQRRWTVPRPPPQEKKQTAEKKEV